ncbi:hypothetical protein A2U01_0060673, partial [Trifolium medium]|nr:hypothetical protein [Trifolium medium]
VSKQLPPIEAKGLEDMWHLPPPSSVNVSFQSQVCHAMFRDIVCFWLHVSHHDFVLVKDVSVD